MSERTKSLDELAEEASDLVRAMEALKSHIDSYKNAEKCLDSASQNLSDLTKSISEQVQQSEKIIEETSKVSVNQMNKWLQAIYAEAQKLDVTLIELREGRKESSEGFASAQAGFAGLDDKIEGHDKKFEERANTLASEIKNMSSTLSEQLHSSLLNCEKRINRINLLVICTLGVSILGAVLGVVF